MAIKNIAKERLVAGKLSIGMGVKALRGFEIGRKRKRRRQTSASSLV